MRHALIRFAVAVALCLPVAARAERVVLAELYTSQGCSACPAADDLLARLAGQEGVLALSLHVDYWDYLGWRDRHARPEWTARQEAYAHAHGERSVYTPQMIIAGRHALIGSDPMAVSEAISRERMRPEAVRLTVAGERLRAVAQTDLGAVIVDLVQFSPSETTAIETGENAGRHARHVNVVRGWQRLGDWQASAGDEANWPLPGAETGLARAVIVQQGPAGAVLAVLRLD